MKSKRISILEFSDYRLFMTVFREGGKARKLSYEALGRRVGMSKMGIKYILDGKRHIADSKITAFSQALDLAPLEKKYFKYLVQFNKAKKSDDRDQFLKKMITIRKAPIDETTLIDRDIGFYSSWALPVIAEMSYMEGFKEDASWIWDNLRFKMSKQAIEQALVELKRLKLLRGQSRGGLKIKLSDGINSQVYNRYQRQVVAKAIEAIEFAPKEDREMSNICISVDKKRFEIAKRMISDFRHKLHDVLANDEVCDRVLQINMQLFMTARSGVEND
jgi:uncharacterized protein (TIGR02147 family)